jgi:hypothetical protein
LDLVDGDDGVLDVLDLSDEAHFYLSSYINKPDFRYRGDKNPMQMDEKPFHNEKLTVWLCCKYFGYGTKKD